ncbi:unnamed protein product, partial [Urochloa humidicola]
RHQFRGCVPFVSCPSPPHPFLSISRPLALLPPSLSSTSRHRLLPVLVVRSAYRTCPASAPHLPWLPITTSASWSCQPCPASRQHVHQVIVMEMEGYVSPEEIEYNIVANQKFKRQEDFYGFYNSYAKNKGFSVAKPINWIRTCHVSEF